MEYFASDELEGRATGSQGIEKAAVYIETFFRDNNIKPYFETTTGESLKSGLKVLLKVSVEFHEVFGFSLNVQDIDPQYTMGDLARKKAEIIRQLELNVEKIKDKMNK